MGEKWTLMDLYGHRWSDEQSPLALTLSMQVHSLHYIRPSKSIQVHFLFNVKTAASVTSGQPFFVAVPIRSDRLDSGDFGDRFLDGLFHARAEGEGAQSIGTTDNAP